MFSFLAMIEQNMQVGESISKSDSKSIEHFRNRMNQVNKLISECNIRGFIRTNFKIRNY